jgi:branched-chain amino acid transport system permease protein
MVYFVALQAPFTGGENGIQEVPRGQLFGFINLSNDLALYGLVLVIVFGGLLGIYSIVHSPFGQLLRAIRDNESRAVSLG